MFFFCGICFVLAIRIYFVCRLPYKQHVSYWPVVAHIFCNIILTSAVIVLIVRPIGYWKYHLLSVLCNCDVCK